MGKSGENLGLHDARRKALLLSWKTRAPNEHQIGAASKSRFEIFSNERHEKLFKYFDRNTSKLTLEMHRKFVILSAARSGTSLLVETLATHPDILIHGEIFHEKSEWHIRPEFLAANDLGKKATEPVKFAREILSQSFGREAVGFKMWRVQSPEACDDILRDNQVLKVILHRDNRLAHVSSCLLAEQTEIWNVRITENLNKDIRKNRIRFRPGHFVNFNKWHDALFDDYKTKANGSVIYLNYLQVCRGEYRNLLNELNVQNITLRHQTQKLYTYDLLERFDPSDHALIRETLTTMGKIHWLKEE